MGTLDGHVALVTGAGRAKGIGRGIALRLAQAGADVAVTDLARPAPALDIPGVGVGDDPAELEQTAEIVRRAGRRSCAVAVDLSSADSVRECVASAVAALGPVTILVNNAGTAVGTGAFEESVDADWELSWTVNVLGTLRMSRAVLPGMKAQGGGTIVNIASTMGVAALPKYGSYAVTKHAVVGLTRLMSQELAPFGVRTNAVAPGYIVTDMGEAELAHIAETMSVTIDEAISTVQNEVPVGRLGAPSDVAGAVTWLADPGSSFINGAVIPVHGGQIPGFA